MKIAIFGSGYVGLVTGACLADAGHRVVCVDIDQAKIESLQRGKVPIFEPGLGQMIARNAEQNRLAFTTDVGIAMDAVDLVFIAVGTPSDEDGSADIRHVLNVAAMIGDLLTRYVVVVDKSTVPVGTGRPPMGMCASPTRARISPS